jgi:hypothetical protein
MRERYPPRLDCRGFPRKWMTRRDHRKLLDKNKLKRPDTVSLKLSQLGKNPTLIFTEDWRDLPVNHSVFLSANEIQAWREKYPKDSTRWFWQEFFSDWMSRGGPGLQYRATPVWQGYSNRIQVHTPFRYLTEIDACARLNHLPITVLLREILLDDLFERRQYSRNFPQKTRSDSPSVLAGSKKI